MLFRSKKKGELTSLELEGEGQRREMHQRREKREEVRALRLVSRSFDGLSASVHTCPVSLLVGALVLRELGWTGPY